jgi:8-oxo-dGTP pyrophosphatase MutT (NUDIX family)
MTDTEPDLPDVRIQTADARFKFRTSAVVVRDGRVLTTSHIGAGYCYLPGGKVRIGETSAAGMRRELIEELGHDLPVGPLLLVAENIYDHEDMLRHEVTHYYLVEPPAELANADLTIGGEPGHELRWVSLAGLAAAGFRPVPVIALLPELVAGRGAVLRHGVFDHPAGA